jgi:hypothetical protein
MIMELIKKTSLEKSDDVLDTLTWKVSYIKESGLPIESGLADYIALALQNIGHELAYLKDVKKQISEREKFMKSQAETIKVDGARFFELNGLEKLEGEICSSVTVTKGKEAKNTETTEDVFTLLIDEEEMRELLIGLGKAEMRKITTTKTTNETPSKLRVNSRKVIKPEVIENKGED